MAACVDADLATGNKDTCVLEIDDTEDADIVDSLMDQFPPSSVQVYSTEDPVGIASGHVVNCCQTFSQVRKPNQITKLISIANRQNPFSL